ncbi:MAG: carboxypeptidase regulatory-like domain-containing protein [Clostridia bacterium]|nr:carboxypeptidase regulatory-like domain-containing protein [Clostridia bacterium]
MQKIVSNILSLLFVGCTIVSIAGCNQGQSTVNSIESSSDTVQTGSLTGCVMYSNKSTGTPSYEDSGAFVQLISLDIKEFPVGYLPIERDYEEYGIFTTTTDSAGDYEFFDIPTGEYRLIIISNNARYASKQILSHFDDIYAKADKLYGEYLGALVEKVVEEKDAFTYYADNYSQGYNITIKADREIKKNETCINWSAIL